MTNGHPSHDLGEVGGALYCFECGCCACHWPNQLKEECKNA